MDELVRIAAGRTDLAVDHLAEGRPASSRDANFALSPDYGGRMPANLPARPRGA